MLCEECQKREATVHYTKVVNNQKTEYHLCEQCAREKGELDFSWGFEPGFSIHNLLAGLLDMSNPSPDRKSTRLNSSHNWGNRLLPIVSVQNVV